MDFLRRFLGASAHNSSSSTASADRPLALAPPPPVIRRDNYSALGRWLHGVGREMLGHHPEYPMLLARHRYFHEQAAEIVELAQQGEWERVVAILNGGYRFASNQIVILLKSIRHSVSQESA